uniref:Uncharacterized protein n=1 Tax=Oryza sativa subsp. japonica TaxID=39947 RepID=Q6ZB60_ORYSJ|nr:hypothetical protein [Oryza sativa Japonica Group]
MTGDAEARTGGGDTLGEDGEACGRGRTWPGRWPIWPATWGWREREWRDSNSNPAPCERARGPGDGGERAATWGGRGSGAAWAREERRRQRRGGFGGSGWSFGSSGRRWETTDRGDESAISDLVGHGFEEEDYPVVDYESDLQTAMSTTVR